MRDRSTSTAAKSQAMRPKVSGFVVSLAGRTESGLRETPSTTSPERLKCSAKCEPTNPVMPVTSAFIAETRESPAETPAGGRRNYGVLGRFLKLDLAAHAAQVGVDHHRHELREAYLGLP